MNNPNENVVKLYRQLRETDGVYEALYQRVQDTELGDAISTILSRRKENIAELETFLSGEGEDLASDIVDPASDAFTSAEVIETEKRILDAYDKAILPITGEHEKYGFLVDQYEWLKGIVDKLEPKIAT